MNHHVRFWRGSRGAEETRRPWRFLAGALLAMLAAPGIVRAADTLHVSADDAITMTLSSGPMAARHRVEVERARAGRMGIGGFLPAFPELEVSAATDAPFLGHGERGLDIGITQEFEIGGQYFLRRDAADAAVSRAELEMQAIELGLRADARVFHARLYAAQERLRLVESLVAFTRRLDTIAQRQYEVGEISELDRNAVRIGATRGEMELLDAGSGIVEAAADLRGYMGLPAGTVVVAVGQNDLDAHVVAAVLDTAATVEAALAAGDDAVLRRRPDWRALERGVERYRAERELASRRLIPDLKLGVGLQNEISVSGAAHDDYGHAHASSRSFDRLLSVHLGLTLPLPFSGIYDLGEGHKRMAEVEIAAIEADRRVLATRITADLAGAIARLRGAAARLALYGERIAPLVSRNMELLERGYAAGELTATEVVMQQEGLLRSAEALVDARRQFAESLAGFERVLGR